MQIGVENIINTISLFKGVRIKKKVNPNKLGYAHCINFACFHNRGGMFSLARISSLVSEFNVLVVVGNTKNTNDITNAHSIFYSLLIADDVNLSKIQNLLLNLLEDNEKEQCS